MPELDGWRSVGIRTRVAALVLIAAAWPLAAQEPPTTDSIVSLRELIVSAARTETSVGETPINVTVVTREQLRLSAGQTLQDVLQDFQVHGRDQNVGVQP